MSTPTTIPGNLIALGDVPTLPWLPRRRHGKRLGKRPLRRGARRPAAERSDGRLNVSTVYRWRDGIRHPDTGELVRLRCVRVGGSWATTEAWLREFFTELSTPGNPGASAVEGVTRAHQDAERQLASVGI